MRRLPRLLRCRPPGPPPAPLLTACPAAPPRRRSPRLPRQGLRLCQLRRADLRRQCHGNAGGRGGARADGCAPVAGLGRAAAAPPPEAGRTPPWRPRTPATSPLFIDGAQASSRWSCGTSRRATRRSRAAFPAPSRSHCWACLPRWLSWCPASLVPAALPGRQRRPLPLRSAQGCWRARPCPACRGCPATSLAARTGRARPTSATGEQPAPGAHWPRRPALPPPLPASRPVLPHPAQLPLSLPAGSTPTTPTTTPRWPAGTSR